MAREKGVQLSRRAVRDLARDLRRLRSMRQNGPPAQGDRNTHGLRWLGWRNDGSSTCPAHGVVRITGNTQIGTGDPAVRIITGDQPSTTFSRLYAINSGVPVEDGDTGWLTFDSGAEVAYDTGTPAYGDGWGPKPSQWTLTKNYPETALVFGVQNATLKTLDCRWHGIEMVTGKFATGFSKGSSGTITLWAGAGGSEAATSITIPNVYSQLGDVTAAKYYDVYWINGVAYCIAAEC
ncbi:MAG TPA: hypothetical protein VGG64_29855 [Pirellulales bacterium]|jgi:hypothetical protein